MFYIICSLIYQISRLLFYQFHYIFSTITDITSCKWYEIPIFFLTIRIFKKSYDERMNDTIPITSWCEQFGANKLPMGTSDGSDFSSFSKQGLCYSMI